MQAKQFWPPTKHKLLYANFIVYGVILVLVLVFHHEMVWAQKTLHGYLVSGNIPPSADKLLIGEALRYSKNGKDARFVQHLFERAVQIEPYSEARLLLGYCHFMQGEYDNMLACYGQYRSINPSNIDIYKGMLEVLRKKQDSKAVEQLLTEGIRHFRRRVELYKPHYDPNVPEVFNQKAFAVYKDAQEGLSFLEKMQEQSNVSK